MEKGARLKIWFPVFLCLLLGLFVSGDKGTFVQGSEGNPATSMAIDRYSTTTNAIKGKKDIEFARVTLTNDGDEFISVYMPRFYAMADTSFDLQDDIDAARLTYSYPASDGIAETDPIEGEIKDGNGIVFNAAFTVLPHSSSTIVMKADISKTAQVQALSFDLDFSSPDFSVINDDKKTLAPFELTGNNSIVCIAGSLDYCPMLNVMTAEDYDLHVAFINQNGNQKGPFYSPYIPEGGMIRDEFGIDVYIVKYADGKRFKRLILSPSVFNSYGHLRWEDIENVDTEVLNSYITSDYAFVAGNSTIWKLEPQGDTGIKRKFLAPTLNPIASCNYDPDGVYEINATDRDSYILGPDITG